MTLDHSTLLSTFWAEAPEDIRELARVRVLRAGAVAVGDRDRVVARAFGRDAGRDTVRAAKELRIGRDHDGHRVV